MIERKAEKIKKGFVYTFFSIVIFFLSEGFLVFVSNYVSPVLAIIVISIFLTSLTLLFYTFFKNGLLNNIKKPWIMSRFVTKDLTVSSLIIRVAKLSKYLSFVVSAFLFGPIPSMLLLQLFGVDSRKALIGGIISAIFFSICWVSIYRYGFKFGKLLF